MSDNPRRGVEGLSRDLAVQRGFVTHIPAYERVLGHLITVLEQPNSQVAKRLEAAWRGRTFYAQYDRPLLLLAALRYEATREGRSHPLHAAIATDKPDLDGATLTAVESAFDRGTLDVTLATRWVQTNETLRSVVWRWPAHVAGCDGGARPLALVDLGASAGLNLVADRLPAVWTDGDQTPIDVVTSVHAVLRLGLDARPVNLDDSASVDWMRACIWPGDRGRLERLEAGLAAWQAARLETAPPTLETCDAADFAARVERVTREHPGALTLAYGSYVRDYLPPDVRAAHRAGMLGWIAKAPVGHVLWLELEAALEDGREETAAVTAHFRAADGGTRELVIARTFHHPLVVKPVPGAVREMRQALGRWKAVGQGC